MEFTRHRRNHLDDADHPSSDSYLGGDDLPAIEQDLLQLADGYRASGHGAFAWNAARQDFSPDLEYDEDDLLSDDFPREELEEEDSGDQDSVTERANDLVARLDAAAADPWLFYSDVESSSDSDAPASHQSLSSTERASPSADSTASEDSLFVTQEQDDEDFFAHVYVHDQFEGLAQQPYIFPPNDHDERLRQSMANIQRREQTPFHLRPIQIPDSDGLEDDLDELFEMEIASRRRGRANRGDAPAPVSVPAAADVIDLTNVPDSPEEISASRFLRSRGQAAQANESSSRRNRANPRRQPGLGRTPSLSRSDGSILGAAPVIDLTLDDDDVDAAPIYNPQPHRAIPPSRALPPIRGNAVAELRRLADDFVVENPGQGMPDGGRVNRMLARFNRNPVPDLLMDRFAEIMVEQAAFFPPRHQAFADLAMADFIANPLANNIPNFNYRGNGYNNQGEPKPPFIPPPPARPGFGRNTAEDIAFVCPSCEEELKYDPDAEAIKPPPAKKARNKKDREEHHFWAVKECGHVYCKKCFDDRKKKTSGVPKTGFRNPDNKTTLCAIEDCTSDVGPKTNWVGVFL